MAAMVAANAPGSAGASSASPPTENLVSKRRAKIPAPPALKIDRNAEDSGSSTPDANGSRSTRSASVDVSMKGDQGVQLRSAPVYRTVLSVETQSAMTGPFSRNADYQSAAFHTIQTTQYTSPLSSGDSSASMLPLVYSGYKCPANGCDSEFVDLASCQQHFAILHSTEDPFSTASQMTSPFTAIQSPNSATTNGSTHPPNLSLLTLDNAAIAGAPGRSWTTGADLTSASLSSSNSVTVVNSGFSPIPYGGFEPSLAYPGPPFQNAPGEGYSSTQPNLSISEDDTLLRLFNQEYPQLFTNAGLSSPGLFPPSDPPPPAPLSASSYFSQNNEFQPIQYMQPTVVLSSQPLPRHSRTQSLSSTVVHHHPHSQPPLSPQYISFTSTTSANPSIQANMVVDYSLNANGTVTAAGPSATNLRLRRGSRVTQLLQEERANLVQQVLRDRERESRLKDSQGNHVESMSLSDGEFCEGVGSSALHTPAALLDPANVGLEPTLVPDNAMPNEAMRLESSSHVMLFDPTHRVKEESDL
ncbi:hypothetical protein BC830DRAFT_711713 [Chytriomyces sp. MP71]|nr:hypothetical protein BC830DRAFT_711713 [Chytriomyces sp. MP71]